MKTWRRTLIATAALHLLVGTVAADTVVYERTGPTPEAVVAWLSEHGDEITLADTERLLTSIDVALWGGPNLPPADLCLRVYDLDGPEGTPGTLLWEDTVLGIAGPQWDLLPVTFAIPQVQVPDTIVFTLENTAGPALGVAMFASPPSIGTFHAEWHKGEDDEWAPYAGELKLWARITAVPEPDSGALAILATIALAARRRCAA